MQIEVPAEFEPFVDKESATGRHTSRQEVVVQALRWLREERQAAVASIKQGPEDIAASRTQPVAEAFADIKREFGLADLPR